MKQKIACLILCLVLAGCGGGHVDQRNTIPDAFSQDAYRPNYGGDLKARYAWALRSPGTANVAQPTVTYRVLHGGGSTSIDPSVPIDSTEPSERQSADIRGAVAKWGEALTGINTAPALVEVPATDATAGIDFVVQNGESFTSGGAFTEPYGRTDLYLPDGLTGRVVRRAVVRLRADLDERTFRLTVLHETGHALGLWGHSRKATGDVMSPVALPSFAIPVIELSTRDKNTIRANYTTVTGGRERNYAEGTGTN